MNNRDFKPSDVRDEELVIHGIGMSGTAFAKSINGNFDGQVFIPQGVAQRFNMLPGDAVRARIIPNGEEHRDRVAWRAIYIYPNGNTPQVQHRPATYVPSSQPKRKEMTDEELRKEIEKLTDDGSVWTTRDMFSEIFEREPDYKDEWDHRKVSSVGNILRAMCGAKKMYRSEIFTHTDMAYKVYFSTDIEQLKPDAYADR